VVNDGVLRVTRGPREHGHRPAVDPLFRSAARHCDGRVCAVVLSGALDDGTAGLAAVAARGGVVVVQDPEDALYPGMPTSALAAVDADHVAPAAEIADIVASLARTSAPPRRAEPPSLMLYETDVAELDMNAISDLDPPGTPSPFTCPDCGGSLFEMPEGDVVRYRCRVGHAFAPGSLAAQQDIALESALWAALRALEERADLSRRLAQGARERGHSSTAHQFEEHERELGERARAVRAALSIDEGALARGEV
jgi:two-component system, chemotaxis family, protein-glutamate methylesterase/glutaminase